MAAVAAPQKSLCTRCEFKFNTVRVLECRHMLCDRCFNRTFNEQIEESLKQGRGRPDTVKCVTCGRNSSIPEPGVNNIVTRMSAVTLTSQPGFGVANIKSCSKVWLYDEYMYIYDSTFYGDGRIAFITQDRDEQWDKFNFQLRALGRDGKLSALPFPAYFKSPHAVASSADNTCIAVVDWPEGFDNQIHVYRETGRGWSCQQFSTTHHIQRIAILPNGRIVGTTVPGKDHYAQLIIYEADGKEVLAVKLPKPPPPPPTCETYWVVNVATSRAGHIILSDPNTNTVSVRDESGWTLTTFPSAFIKQPRAVCTDSVGDVMIYDWENNSVSLHTSEGRYLRHIVTPEIVAYGLSLYQDRYLLLRNVFDGMLLYELK